MNDLLMEKNWSVNTHRGMTFGMNLRGFSPMWKLWDNFGISDSKMIGFWDNDPFVSTDNKKVLSTAFVKEGQTLISIASWVDQPLNIKLNIDWNRLGLKQEKVRIFAPEIKDYQKEKTFKIDELIPIEANSDCILIITNNQKN